MAMEPELPLLAIVHSAKSVSAFDLAAAAEGLCRVGFVVDGPERSMLRLLRHFGPVVDTAGLSQSEAVEEIRAIAPLGITTFLDDLLPRTAVFASDLGGFPFHSPEVTATLVDKFRQREALQLAGVPGPRFFSVGPDEDLDALKIEESRDEFPVVIKPRGGAASRETTMAANPHELLEALRRARALQHEAVIVEEYLKDFEPASNAEFASFVSVESVLGAGKLRHLAVAGKFPLAPPFREGGHFTPSHLSAETLEAVLDMVEIAVRALGISVGGLHTEVKLTPAGPRIVEINGRTGGGPVPEVLSVAGGGSLIKAAMEVALGQLPSDEGLFPCERVGFKINVQPPMSAQRVTSVEGLDAVAGLPGILQVNLRHNVGDPVNWRLGTEELVLDILGEATDLEAMQAMRRRVDDLLSISYD
jgi:biotin carboxylase